MTKRGASPLGGSGGGGATSFGSGRRRTTAAGAVGKDTTVGRLRALRVAPRSINQTAKTQGGMFFALTFCRVAVSGAATANVLALENALELDLPSHRLGVLLWRCG